MAIEAWADATGIDTEALAANAGYDIDSLLVATHNSEEICG